MARAMNVEKRIETLRNIVNKTMNHGARALKIADELVASFEGERSAEAKQALKAAQVARKLAAALEKAAGSVAP